MSSRRTIAALLAVLILATAHTALAQPTEAGVAEPPAVTPASRGAGQTHAPFTREQHYGRALLETLVLLGIGEVAYLADLSTNQQDWDIQLTEEDVRWKFTTLGPLRFDNNSFLYNQVLHPISYNFIYLFARANNLRPSVSLLYALGASVFWEYVGELPEKPSINDIIVSPLAGMAWGEVAYHYGEYFNSPEISGRTGHQILTALWGVPRLGHDWLDDTEPAKLDPNLSPLYHPRFELFSAMQFRQSGDIERPPSLDLVGVAGLDTDLVVLRGYHEPVTFDQWFGNGNFSSVHAEVAFGRTGLTDVEFGAQTTIWGYYRQDLRERPGVALSGYSLLIGAARAYDITYRDHQFLDDLLGRMHILGPSLLVESWDPSGLYMRAGLRAFFDFTAVKSQAYPEWKAEFGDQGVRSELKKGGYYFGWGATVAPEVALGYGPYLLSAELEWAGYEGIDGLDRFEEEVTRQLDLHDRLLKYRVSLGLPLPVDDMTFHIDYESIDRRSSVEDVVDIAGYRSFELRLDYWF